MPTAEDPLDRVEAEMAALLAPEPAAADLRLTGHHVPALPTRLLRP
jgi:hypothetical protein